MFYQDLFSKIRKQGWLERIDIFRQQFLVKCSVRQWYNLFASFSNGIQPFSEAKTACLGIHATLGLSKSLRDHTIA